MTYENITERQVLCFGDSNTYGYDPVRDGRYGPDERYPMVLQSLLGPGWAVAEEGLPGRTAVFDDPITEGMNGLRLINPILMSHAPLDTVTIMLGTNDCKARFACDSYQIAQGIARLTKKALQTECWRDNAHPDVLVIVPPVITPAYDRLIFREEMGPGCHERCAGIAARLAPMLQGLPGVRFLDANTLPGAGMLAGGRHAYDEGSPQGAGAGAVQGADRLGVSPIYNSVERTPNHGRTELLGDAAHQARQPDKIRRHRGRLSCPAR